MLIWPHNAEVTLRPKAFSICVLAREHWGTGPLHVNYKGHGSCTPFAVVVCQDGGLTAACQKPVGGGEKPLDFFPLLQRPRG